MNKKSRIITWVIIAILAVAAIAIIITTTLNGGAESVDTSTFVRYVNHNGYYVENGAVYNENGERANPEEYTIDGKGNILYNEQPIAKTRTVGRSEDTPLTVPPTTVRISPKAIFRNGTTSV